MSVTAVVGAQFGDEGKGRIVDYLAAQADLVIRFQGGDNAGHTVVNEIGEFRLHLVPSGIFHAQTTCLIGAGAVVNPQALLVELDELEASGVDTSRLLLAARAQMLMPYHRMLDGLQESARGGQAIGTTGRGIGPAYADKAARSGLRLGDLLHPDWLRRRLELVLPRVNHTLQHYGADALDLETLLEECRAWAARLGERIVDSLSVVRPALVAEQNILLEGQLGVMRDLDWGTYPYVTSSNPTAAFAAVGAGLPPQSITSVIGVAKAYSTAVGAGPYPGELTGEVADRLRDIGREYGATTGRPRRIGWFDAVAVRHAAWLNGLTGLALTKLDVLDSLAEIGICTAYRTPDGRVVETVPDTPELESVQAQVETWPGWQTATTAARSWGDLPAPARRFLTRLQELAGVPIRFVSVGPERDAMFAV